MKKKILSIVLAVFMLTATVAISGCKDNSLSFGDFINYFSLAEKNTYTTLYAKNSDLDFSGDFKCEFDYTVKVYSPAGILQTISTYNVVTERKGKGDNMVFVLTSNRETKNYNSTTGQYDSRVYFVSDTFLVTNDGGQAVYHNLHKRRNPDEDEYKVDNILQYEQFVEKIYDNIDMTLENYYGADVYEYIEESITSNNKVEGDQQSGELKSCGYLTIRPNSVLENALEIDELGHISINNYQRAYKNGKVSQVNISTTTETYKAGSCSKQDATASVVFEYSSNLQRPNIEDYQ